MTTVQERFLALDFGEAWEVVKWDDHRDYREKIERLKPSAAVDVVGVYKEKLFLIELKDFRGYRIENKEKFDGPLQVSVATKARDTIAGLIGASRTSIEPALWSSPVKCLATPHRDLYVVLVLATTDLPVEREAARLSVETKLLKEQIRWLTTRAIATGLVAGSPLPDVTIRSLPGAPPRGKV